ncbi:MAG: TIGR02099 family protein [Xanthomonadales bacterium]|nr:TIGR02099 family protein [Xanthomonadales bacterium]
MTTWRRRWRRLRRFVLYGLAVLVIFAGVLVAGASQLLPLVREHPQEIADWLSKRSGKTVDFRLGDAVWTRRGPLITLDGLRIGEGRGAIEVGRAQLLVSVYSGLLPGRALTELHLRGLDLKLQESEDGRWTLGGFGGGGGDGDALNSLQGLGEIRIDGARLTVDSAKSGLHYELERIDARLLALGGRVRFGLSAWHGDAPPLRIAGDLDASLQQGDLYAGGKRLPLAHWLEGLMPGGIGLAAGDGDLDLWARIDQRRLVSVRASADVADLALYGVDSLLLDSGEVQLRSAVERLRFEASWRREEDGWRLDLPVWGIEDGGSRFDGEAIWLRRQADGWQAQAAQLDLQPLLSFVMLSSRLSPRLREWLYAAVPSARLGDLVARCSGGVDCRGQAHLENVTLARMRRVPGVEGVSGRLDFDADGGQFQFDPATFHFDARGLFRGTQNVVADGSVGFWRSGNGWRIGTDSLGLVTEDVGLRAKGWIELQNDGSRPRVDLFAETAPGPLSAAGQFWVPRKMPAKVIRWLDQALVDGRTGQGRLLIQGDFDDWPFRSPEQGHFEAVVQLDDVTLDYQPGDWPRAEHLNGVARFLNEGMEVAVEAQIAGVKVARATGVIDDFRKARLLLDIAGSGSGERLLQLLHRSPLEHRYGEQMQGLSIGGEGSVAVALDLPFKAGLGDKRVNGRVDLSGADLASTRWGLEFAAASGRVEFSDEGFLASELRVGYREQAASLSIAVGAFTSVPGHAVEATLRGRFDVDGLLAEDDSTLWLQPYLQGAAETSLFLSVGRGPAAIDGGDQDADSLAATTPETRLRVRSDLVGVETLLPAPLKKVAAAKMPVDLSLDLPATWLDLRLGGLMQLRARFPDAGGLAGTAVFGGGDAPPADGVDGLHVNGSVAVLDAAGWAMLASGDGAGAELREVAVDIGQLDLLGRSFADTHLALEAGPDGDRLVRFAGTSLNGSVEVPGTDLATRGITGRFKRLYWPSADLSQSNRMLSSLLPSAVPPLHFSIDDLHFADARLGSSRLESYPTPEGLHVEQFETRSDDLILHASGNWQLVDGSERSSFNLRFTSESVAKMLKSLGFSSILEGGQTLVELNGGWAGSPSAFALAKLEGELRLSVGEGRIPDVDPGAGRLLGLVSLTEIPRRLSLDFSDFFQQGFSFNAIAGDFRLDDGNALTDDLHIDSPAADIHISGRTGLVARDYDQRMEVLPRTSSVLPVVGALAGGPAGAAIGAVAQAMLQKPMKQMGRTLYHVGGSWEEPQIEVLEKGPARERSHRRGRVPAHESSSAEGSGGSTPKIAAPADTPAASPKATNVPATASGTGADTAKRVDGLRTEDVAGKAGSARDDSDN